VSLLLQKFTWPDFGGRWAYLYAPPVATRLGVNPKWWMVIRCFR